MRRFRDDNRGSVVVFIVFIIALGIGGFFYKIANMIVEATQNDAPAKLSATTEYQTFIWFGTWAILILILIGLFVWFVSSLQKSKYARI